MTFRKKFDMDDGAKPMKPITIRLSAEHLTAIDQLVCDGKHPSVSNYIRSLISVDLKQQPVKGRRRPRAVASPIAETELPDAVLLRLSEWTMYTEHLARAVHSASLTASPMDCALLQCLISIVYYQGESLLTLLQSLTSRGTSP